MVDFKLITKDTNIDELQMHKVDWDVVVGKGEHRVEYQVVDIPGYVHTVGGKWGDNSYWCYPRYQKPTYENLIEYDGNGGADFGIIMYTHNYIKSKWDETELRSTKNVMITRNGKSFYLCHSITEALHLIDNIDEHPLELHSFEFEKKMIGRKVWYRSQPAVITSWIGNGQACVILEPDGMDGFATPPEFADHDLPVYDENDYIKVEIFSPHIWWFRE